MLLTPRREAAVRLAIVGGRYYRALHRVDTHDTESNSAQQVANKLLAEVRLVLYFIPRKSQTGPRIHLTWGLLSLA